MATSKIKIGIIGASILYDTMPFDTLSDDVLYVNGDTPFGLCSGHMLDGRIKDVEFMFLTRHGRYHRLQAGDVNYRANIWALKQNGCTHVIAMSAARSLREDYRPGDLVVVDDYIDRTWDRKCTFFDNTEGGPRGVCHLPQVPAFCARARAALVRAARAKGLPVHETGTVVVIEGPRFSTRAEGLAHQQWGGHLVDMTTLPEAVLAKEAGMSYAALAYITDYDCWRQNGSLVSGQEINEMYRSNAGNLADVIKDAGRILASETDLSYLDAHQELVKSSIMLKE